VEPEPQHDAAPAPTAPGLNMLIIIGELIKMSQTVTASHSPHHFYNILIFEISEEKIYSNLVLTFVGFKKVDLVYSVVGW
jgi:hypothetical protein